MQPLFDYADTAWSEISEGCCKELQRLKNRAARIILLYLSFITLSKTEQLDLPVRRGSKGFFSGGVDPMSNVSAGTELQATEESAGASARYHTQDGRHPGETIFSELLSGVACVPCVTVKMAVSAMSKV